MVCRGFWECLLKLLNFLMTLAGLAVVGYGIYLFVMYTKASSDSPIAPVSADERLIQLGRPLLMTVSLSDNILDKLPRAWFLYLFIGAGVVLFVISCCGCIGATARNGCCLTIQIPKDKTGNFDMIYDFLKEHWTIAKWVLLGIVVFEAVLFLLTVIVKAANGPADYDSDDEYINPNPRQTAKQPLINRQPQATGVPVVGALDQRPSRNDAWSARMREKYGLDTSEFTYNPNDPTRYQQPIAQPTEERGRCTIM